MTIIGHVVVAAGGHREPISDTRHAAEAVAGRGVRWSASSPAREPTLEMLFTPHHAFRIA